MAGAYVQGAMEVDQTAGAVTATENSKSAVRSCTTCSKAKAKCVQRPGQHICERCARLSKECHSREPVLRRRKVVKATRAAQLEKLEGKIEHLVNALSKSQSQRGFASVDYGQPSPPVSSASDREDRSQRSSRHELINAICDEELHKTKETPSTAATTTTQTPSTTTMPPLTPSDLEDPCNLGVSMSGAEILLDRYRRLMAHANPFVIVGEDITAETLNAKKPFLLHAIVTITYFHDFPRQQLMVKQMMRDLSERMLINGEKSLDLIQGIIVFVSWYYPHVFWAPQVTNLLHLAIAMIVELGLDRPSNPCAEWKHASVKAIHSSAGGRAPTMEEHRALAGVYYLTGMVAPSMKKSDAMPFTKYMDEAMTNLQRAAEYDSDLVAVQLVRLHRLIQEACTLEATSAPPQIYIRAFKADLERLRLEDPSKDPENVFLKMQYLTAEILIYEVALVDLQENNAKPSRAHLDDLYRCLHAIKGFVGVYFTIPSSVYLTVPFSTYGQFAHAFIAMVRLASLEIEGWDLKDLQDKLDFINTIDEVSARFDAATKSSPDGLTINNDNFSKWSHRLRWMKSAYEAKFSQDGGDTAEKMDDRGDAVVKAVTLNKPPNHPQYPPPQYSAAQGVQQITPPDDVLSGDFFNYLDEGFWQSFGNDFDLGFADMTMNAMGFANPTNAVNIGQGG